MNFSEKQLKEALKTIRLSHDERTAIRSALHRHMSSYTKPIKSPFVQHAHRFILRPMQAMAIMLVVLVSSGTGLSYAASEALPGDPLYGFKIGITEELKTLAMKDETRANYEVARAAKRLEETAQLALTGRLNHDAEIVIREQLMKHTEKAKKFAQKASSEKPEAPATIASDINSELSAHSQVLTEIKQIKQINGELSGILETTKETIAIAVIDEQDALEVLAANNENPKVTTDRIAEQRKKLEERLAILEGLVTTPVEDIESALLDISADLKTITIAGEELPLEDEVSEEIDLPTTEDALPEEETKEEIAVGAEVVEVVVAELPLVEAEIKENEQETLEDPIMIGEVTNDLILIRELSDASYKLEDEEELAKASAKLQEAIKRMNNILSLIKLQEKYSAVLEKELIVTPEIKKEELIPAIEEAKIMEPTTQEKSLDITIDTLKKKEI
jgi:hypothetical protein